LILLTFEITVSWICMNLLLVVVRTLTRRHSSILKHLPGPKSSNWLWDHVFDVLDEPLAYKVTDWINERPYPEGLMHLFGLFGSEYLIPTSPEALTEVLSHRQYDYEKPSGFKRFTKRFWGHGIVSQEQEEHKANRKTYLPVFNQSNVKRLRPMLTKKSRQFADHISDLCTANDFRNNCNPNSTTVHIAKVVDMVSMDVTGLIALGVDFETILGKNHEIFHAHEVLFESNKEKRSLFTLYNIAPQWILNLIPSATAKEMDQAHDIMTDVCRRTIRQRLDQLEKGEEKDLDFLTNLVKSESFDEEKAIAQIVVIIGAGFESTGGTLAWVIYCLATYQESQQRLREELIHAKDGKGSLEEEDYDRLPMLNAIVMEATRLYPTFTLLLRKAIRDTTICDQVVPKGTFVGMCTRAINCAQHLWGADAEKFKPDRWIDQSDSESPKIEALGGAPASVCMLSFFHGIRSCVGRALALAQMKRQVALLVERFHIERTENSDPRPVGLFATGPPPTLKLRFTELGA
ncbi:cytochrome P450, partial [Aspergillus steynii IBT 23096]